MGKFNQGKSFGGRSSYGGRSERKTMYKAVCSECGNECEVPFRPTGGKPVYCDNCFGGRGNDNSRRNDRRDFGRRGGDKVKYKAVCSECGKECELPFRPRNDKPVYCDDCFDKKGNKRGSSNMSSEQLQAINEKLDLIMTALKIKTKKIEPKKEEVKEMKKETKKTAAKKTVAKKTATKKTSPKKAVKKTTAKKTTTKKATAKKTKKK